MSSSKGKIQRLFTAVEENTGSLYVIKDKSILIQTENRLKNHIPGEAMEYYSTEMLHQKHKLSYLEDLVFHKMGRGYCFLSKQHSGLSQHMDSLTALPSHEFSKGKFFQPCLFQLSSCHKNSPLPKRRISSPRQTFL